MAGRRDRYRGAGLGPGPQRGDPRRAVRRLRFARTCAPRSREVLDADDRIPFVRRRGEYLYNFWQDAEHPKGLWRRTTLAEYRRDQPGWEILLDVDALAAQEGENWVWQGASRAAAGRLPPGAGAPVPWRRRRERGPRVRHRRAPLRRRRVLRTRGQDRRRVDRRRPDLRGHRLRPRIADLIRLPAAGEGVAPRHPAVRGGGGLRGQTGRCGGRTRSTIRPRGSSATSWCAISSSTAANCSCAPRGGDLVQVPVPEDAIVDVHREWLLVQHPVTVDASAAPAIRPGRCLPPGSTRSSPASGT